MKNNYRINIYIVFFTISIIFFSILVFNNYVKNEKNQSFERLAIISFSTENETFLSITCEVSSTPQELSEGLMNRRSLPKDKGMLFVYETPQNVSFWMKNTLIPLDIIFIDETGIIINIESADVEPYVSDKDKTRYYSLRAAKFVVEINKGLSIIYGIKEGTHVFIKYL